MTLEAKEQTNFQVVSMSKPMPKRPELRKTVTHLGN